MMPCPLEIRGSLDALSCGCHVTAALWEGAACCCRLASPPHKTTRRQSKAVLAGWIIHLPSSSTPAMERLWLMSTQILLIMLCVPLRQAHRDTWSQKIWSFCLNSNMICAALAVFLCLLQQVSDMEAPHPLHPPVFALAPLGLPAALWCSVAARILHAISAFSRKGAVFFRRVPLRRPCSRAGPCLSKSYLCWHRADLQLLHCSSTVWIRYTRDVFVSFTCFVKIKSLVSILLENLRSGWSSAAYKTRYVWFCKKNRLNQLSAAVWIWCMQIKVIKHIWNANGTLIYANMHFI